MLYKDAAKLQSLKFISTKNIVFPNHNNEKTNHSIYKVIITKTASATFAYFTATADVL